MAALDMKGEQEGTQKDLPATGGAVVAPIWLDELAIAAVPDLAMSVD